MTQPNQPNQSELREQINAIREELVGRNQTHQKVAKLSNWSRIELENVIKQDGWIYEDEMIALVQAHTNAEIAKVLDRLQHELDGGRTYTSVSLIEDAVQAERAKLKELK